MDTYNLYNLQDDVLFKSNDSFYDFAGEVCVKVEANILRVQGIRNARYLIRATNLLDIPKLDCDEINRIKADACFEYNRGDLVIKQGTKLNLDKLFDALKEKHENYKKKHHHQQQNVVILSSTLVIDSNNSNN
ncbi:unnamed protein product [Adineta steineri]|uniref:Uncharacterized protein n=2 Tax=Adineta steineri TaxID=433720 RepID=A0A814KUU5_9BILA|nr:unnamed protein product [Adineta steineri]